MLFFLRSFCYTKVYLKTKKMTNISQAQAGFKANSRRNPLWISRLFNAKDSCACRNRLNFRLFRYTPVRVAAMQHHIRASSSAGQSWRLITARPYRFRLFKTAIFRCFLKFQSSKKRFHLLFTYEGSFERPSQVRSNFIRAISLTVKAGGS